MGLPADVPHVTQSDVGWFCTGHVCSACMTCADCGRVLNGTPHIEVCACADSLAHYLCESCEQQLGDDGLL